MNKDEFKISPEINPGEDFYERCCKIWMENNLIPSDKSRFSSFDKLYEENRERLMKIVKESDNKKISKLFNLYQNNEKRDEKTIINFVKLFIDFLKKNSISFIDNYLSSRGISCLFPIYLETDIKDSDKYILTIAEPKTGLSKNYYIQPEYSEIREQYKKHIKNLLSIYNIDLNESDIYQFESNLADYKMLPEDSREVEKSYHRIMVSVLKKNYSNISWGYIFREYSLREDDYVNVINLDTLSYINGMMENIKIDYYIWRFISMISKYSFKEAYDEYFNFYGKILSGILEPESIEKRAYNFTSMYVGELIGKEYISKFFNSDSKTYMEDLVWNLKDSFKERILKQDWMSDETKIAALKKLNLFKSKIGYSNKLDNYEWLFINQDYNCLPEIVLSMNNIYELHEISKKFGKPVDKDEWYMNPQTVNAYYDPSSNEICFPAGILQFPFFSLSSSEAWNYGAIGVVIGHEMTHGFDDQGRKFDGMGNLNSWWTEDDKIKFTNETEKLVSHFSKIEVCPGIKGNGKLTLGENIADHGGLMISLEAFKKKCNPGKEELKEFFEAYASVWAGNIRQEEIIKRTNTDPHSLGRWRVNGTLPHINDWYYAFDITEDDSLFLKENQRFNIW